MDDEPPESTLESQIDAFVSLESDLSERAALTADDVAGTVVSADRVPAAEVPDDYPLAVETPTALRLGVAVTDETTVATFLEWPERFDGDTQLERLLDVVDLPPDAFADLYGREVALAYREGHHVLDLGRTAGGDGLAGGSTDPAGASESSPGTATGTATTTATAGDAVRRPAPETEGEAFGPRLLAFGADLVILGAAAGGLWLLFFLLQLVLVGDGSILGAFPVALRGVLWLLIGTVVGGYYAVLDGPYDGTVGKRAAGVTVATADGEPIGAKRALVRTAVLVAPLPLVALLHLALWVIGLPFGLLGWAGWLVVELAVAAVTDRHRRLGDYLAGTVVVEAT